MRYGKSCYFMTSLFRSKPGAKLTDHGHDIKKMCELFNSQFKYVKQLVILKIEDRYLHFLAIFDVGHIPPGTIKLSHLGDYSKMLYREVGGSLSAAPNKLLTANTVRELTQEETIYILQEFNVALDSLDVEFDSSIISRLNNVNHSPYRAEITDPQLLATVRFLIETKVHSIEKQNIVRVLKEAIEKWVFE